MEEIGVCKMGTRTDPSFPEELGTNNSVSRLVLSNYLSYNLCSFVQELVHLGKSLLSKMARVKYGMCKVEDEISL